MGFVRQMIFDLVGNPFKAEKVLVEGNCVTFKSDGLKYEFSFADRSGQIPKKKWSMNT